jgi:amidase
VSHRLFQWTAVALLAGSTIVHAAPSRSVADLVVEGTIADLQRRIRSREISCEAVVSAYLQRIRAYDQPELNAITSTATDGIAQARAADRALNARAVLPPLFCVPIVIKDNIDVAGLPTTAGSIALRDSVPPDDAAIVRELRAAGAIVLAKTNMAEWAFSPRRTISSTANETANAYALDRVPAGSSGGTASAVAASFALAGLGTDTGNSIRGPSSHLALVGMRATYGRNSLDGIVPLLLDHDAVGPMTRTVEDNARLLTVLARTATAADAPSAVDYAEGLPRGSLARVRIGVLRALAKPDETDPQIAQLFAAAIDELRRAGAVIVDDVTIDHFAEHMETGYYCPRFRADVNAYLHTLGPRAPVTDVADVFRAGTFAPESREQFEFFMREPAADQPSGATCPPFAANAGRQAYRRDVIAAMDRGNFAALIYPTWRFPPAARVRAVEDYRGDNSQLIAPSTGLPALTVPMGFNEAGLPAGLQLLGRPWSEAQLYGIAWHYEHLTRHRKAPKLFPPLSAKSD